MSLFSPLMKRKKKKIDSLSIFEEFYLNLRRKIWKFLTLDNLNIQKIELYKNPCWRHPRNETISTSRVKPIKHQIQKLELSLSWTNLFVIYPNNPTIPLQILSYWGSNVVAPISSLIYKISFSFSWLSIIQILFSNLLTVCWLSRRRTQNSLWNFCTVQHKATIFSPPCWSNF